MRRVESEEAWSGGGLRLLATGSGGAHVRATLGDDGEVRDGHGALLAYIEANGEVGDAGMTFLGRALEAAAQVVDASDAFVGEFDTGRGYIKDAQGSVVAEVSKEGAVKNNAGQGVGTVDNFHYGALPTLAAYFLLVDPSFLAAAKYGAQ